jgi:hypothetical protein
VPEVQRKRSSLYRRQASIVVSSSSKDRVSGVPMRELIRQLEERQASIFHDVVLAIESEYAARELQHAKEEAANASTNRPHAR